MFIMCRLGGVVLSKKDRSDERITEITEALLMLLVNMEEAYGGDGNGLSVHWDNGRTEYLKDHREANYFFRHFSTLKQWLKEGASIVQLHARLSTGGSSENHDNLHPFTHGDIVGAHNGTIDDRLIWSDLNTIGVEAYSDVDSEAIFASINTFAPTLHPKLLQVPINDLYGMFALSIWSKKKANSLLLVKQDNPLCYWIDRANGEFWYASTGDLLPESLDIETVPVKTMHTYGTNKGQYYMKQVPNITELSFGDALYVKSGDGNMIYLDKIELDVYGTTNSSYRNDYVEDDYYNQGYTEVFEDGKWFDVDEMYGEDDETNLI